MKSNPIINFVKNEIFMKTNLIIKVVEIGSNYKVCAIELKPHLCCDMCIYCKWNNNATFLVTTTNHVLFLVFFN